jgi:hypothetical protein
MSIFGDFWNKKLTASFWPRLWPLPPKRKKLQLEPILTNYGLISSSGHLEDAYMSLNCLKRLNHGKKMVLKWLDIGKSLFTYTKKKREPKLVYGCRHLAEFTQHYKTGYFERPICHIEAIYY